MQDLKLGELLDNPPPGIDEAVAISRVVRFLRDPAYNQFRCVVFDTAPTGHTLRLLTLPDFLNTGVGKLVRLRFTIANAVSKVTDFFSRKKDSGRAVDKAMLKLEELQVRCYAGDGKGRVCCNQLCMRLIYLGTSHNSGRYLLLREDAYMQ
jgi:arsenite/tail-anchored protein-transporting ATPase